MTYPELEERTQEAADLCRRLSGGIKTAEGRMAEIAVLRKHIINYAKTREVYVEYRKAGYSKKFLAEYEADVNAHKAAKKYFDQLDLKKLPKVKTLQEEYNRLLAQKKSDHAEYHKVREEMKELLTVKRNLDQILGYDKNPPVKDDPKRNDGSQSR